jgi:legumain
MNTKLSVAICLAILLLGASCANWAVLVAGSDGFHNYRHQSDVFHAYQALIKKGMDKSKIIVMAYDDIAKDLYNPVRGKVFNKPSYKEAGVDVYEGVAIDYRAHEVTPAIFKDVLLGNKSAVSGKGTGRVLESTSADNVFVFFCDHGATGLIAFPNSYLYANDFITILNSMRGRYNKLVFYLEACESGSMFVNLTTSSKIYALSAANTSESSWATYCAPDDVVGGKHIGSCLGDLFSISFIEDIDNSDISTETLDVQFGKVKARTNLSMVLQWGDTSFIRDVVGSFIGKPASLRRASKAVPEIREPAKMKPYFAKINFLANQHRMNPSFDNRHKLMAEMRSMQLFDNLFFLLKDRLALSGMVDPTAINFDCLKSSVEYIETRCGKLS